MNYTQINMSLTHHTSNSLRLNNRAEVKLLLSNKKIKLIFSLDNLNNKLLIPPAKTPAQRDNLWQHLCCEAFIGIVDQPEYLEFNFSPSGEWAAYQFSDYRKRIEWNNPTPPEIHTTRTKLALLLETTIRLDTLPAIFQNQPLEIGISTVLEDKDHNLAYLALAHSQNKPDFHRRDQWIKLTP